MDFLDCVHGFDYLAIYLCYSFLVKSGLNSQELLTQSYAVPAGLITDYQFELV